MNKLQEKQVPELRFKEYSNDWSHDRLGDFVSLQSGYAFKSKYFSESGKKLVIPKNFTKTGYSSFTDINTKFTTEIPDEKYICKANDLLVLLTDLTSSCELLGKPLLVSQGDGQLLLNQRIVKVDINNKELSKEFTMFLLLTRNYHNKIKSTATGSTVRHSSNDILRSYKFGRPSLKEQQKIAKFLTSVDQRISLLKQKKAALETYKKGLMQKIFNQEIRFKDKNGHDFPDWEIKSFSDIGKFHYGKSAPKWSITAKAKTPCIRYGELYTKFNCEVDRVYSFTEIEKEKLKFSKGGELLIPRVGEDPLDFCKVSYIPFKNVAIGEMISVFKTDQNTKFLAYYIRSNLKYEFAKVVEGANVSNLYFRYLEPIKLALPTKKEQFKIVEFITLMDQSINKLNKQIEQTTQFKKGLLQRMFV